MPKEPDWIRYMRWNEGGPAPASPPSATSARPDCPPELLTVVVPTKNRARYLRATIDSILNQDYPAIECIVIDGASIDGSDKILQSYGDRIRWISEPDTGPFDAINKGWAMASGQVLAWLNADDTYTQGAVGCAMHFLATHPDVSVVHGACGLTDGDGNLSFLLAAPRWDLDVAFEHCEHFIYQPTAFIRREALERAGGGVVREWSHDYDLWFRIALTGGVIQEINVHLANARRDQPENDYGLPDRYGPAMVSMIRRLSLREDLPPRLQVRRQRALSNAQARCVRYLSLRFPRHWLIGAISLTRACRTDPPNSVAVLSDSLVVIGWNHPSAALAQRTSAGVIGGLAKVAGRLGPRFWSPGAIAMAALAIQIWGVGRAIRERPGEVGL